MAPVGTVVATRYHNVICALQLGKPTISLGYAKKNVVLMEDMGLPEFCQYADSIDVGKLIEQFTKLESNADQVRTMLAGAQRGEGHACWPASSPPWTPCSSQPGESGRDAGRYFWPGCRTPAWHRRAARRTA